MSLPRTLLERFSRNRSFERRLPPDLGSVRIVVSPDASLRFWKPGLKSDLFDFAREFITPGSTVWDVGANVGLLTMAAAQRSGPAGQVVAIEADIWLAGLLRRSVAIQPRSSAPIRVVPAAASDSFGIVSIHIANRGRATNYLDGVEGSSQVGGIRETVNILGITLDWLLEQGPPPSILKIDVEGAEALVFRGATRILTEVKPVILCEVHDSTREYVTESLQSNGYTLYDWDAPVREVISLATFNTLALPPKA